MHQKLMYAFTEHTHRELMRALSILWIMNLCVLWPYTSGTNAVAEHTHLFLKRTLSISVQISNLERYLHKMLSIRVRNWRVQWAYSLCTYSMRARIRHIGSYVQHAHKKLMIPIYPQIFLFILYFSPKVAHPGRLYELKKISRLAPLTLIRMTKDEKGLAFFKGLLL